MIRQYLLPRDDEVGTLPTKADGDLGRFGVASLGVGDREVEVALSGKIEMTPYEWAVKFVVSLRIFSKL